MVYFWVIFFIVFYTYILYPLLLKVISFFYNENEITFNVKEILNVDFVILAYNEEKVIYDKILNSLDALKKINGAKLWIVSDGSTDKTNQIVTSLIGNPIIEFIQLKRSGKSQSINSIIPLLKGDIIVFSDANVDFSKSTIINLLKPFNDINVGCTCGKVIYRNPNNVNSGDGESMYWKYENEIKKLESKIGYVAGATGAVYAIRRELFHPLPSNCINDDFTISMKIVEAGFKCKYVENAVVYENVAPTIKDEFKRHVRDATGHYISIIHLIKLVNLFIGARSFIFWSHRLIRWAVPFLLILLFIINTTLLDKIFYSTFFYCQIIFYFFAIVGIFTNNNNKINIIFFVPFYFCNLNFALFLGFLNSIFVKQKGIWESTAR
jgi:cellulose synthase/poly-beta-1,6-N-acetylglucosamine synthase-like glycosyltransferase